MPASNVYYAFIIENNTAKRVTIKKGEEFDEFIEIKSGLKSEDIIVVTGQTNLKDGSLVTIREGGLR